MKNKDDKAYLGSATFRIEYYSSLTIYFQNIHFLKMLYKDDDKMEDRTYFIVYLKVMAFIIIKRLRLNKGNYYYIQTIHYFNLGYCRKVK